MSPLRAQHNIAIVLLQAGKSEASLAFFQSITQDAGFGMAVKYELMARAAYSSSDLRGAVKYQRLALDDYSTKVNLCTPSFHVLKLALVLDLWGFPLPCWSNGTAWRQRSANYRLQRAFEEPYL